MDSKSKETYLEINIPLCTGCRSCEIACSFHLKGVCDPTISKIKITRDNEIGEIFCELPQSCPECSFEAEPPCVSSCATGALTIRERNNGSITLPISFEHKS